MPRPAMLRRRTAYRNTPTGGGPDPDENPNADISRDMRVLLKLNPDDFADGTYWAHPGTYFGGDCGDIRGSAFLHPFNAAKPRNGWLRVKAFTPGTCTYDGSLTAGGSSASDAFNGGALAFGGQNSGLSGPNGIGALRSMIEGFIWNDAGPVMTGTSRLILAGNQFNGLYSRYKTSIFDAVCTLRGASIVTLPPDNSTYVNVYEDARIKNQANYDGLRLETTNFGNTLTPCSKIRLINNDVQGYGNDGRFIGDGAFEIFGRGNRYWNIHHGSVGALLTRLWHSDVTQLTGQQHDIDFDYELWSGNDFEFAAETGSISNVVVGSKTGSRYNVWNMGSDSTPMVLDASTHGIGSSNHVTWQWFAAGQNPFGSGYDNGFDVEKITFGSPTAVLDLSHVKPAALRVSANLVVDILDAVNDPLGPFNIFRTNPVNALGAAITNTTDAICSAYNLFD